jgi:hypothetical protein
MTMRFETTSRAVALALPLFVLGCDGPKAHTVPWAHKRTQIIDGDRKAVEVAPLDTSKNCVAYQGQCFAPKHGEACGHGADVFIDRDGKVLDFICYPGEETLSVDEIEQQQGDIAQSQNNSVVLLDELDDGADIEGDVTIDANKVVIYGESPATAVIAGNVTIDGNNAIIRGVHIGGNLAIIKNDALVALCVIEGDLEISANNAEILGCDVLGNVRVTGNNVKLYGNRIAGTLSVTGNGSDCQDNAAVTDTDGDGVVDPEDLGAPLTCG